MPPLRWGYTFVANKYYLDALYEGVIVHAIAHPIAKAAYWVNQHVIDGIVNGIGRTRQAHRGVDVPLGRPGRRRRRRQRLRRPRRGDRRGAAPDAVRRVNQYGALLFGAATVGAIVLVIINV